MIKFIKYCASGNDFLIINNFDSAIDTLDTRFWSKVSDRHFGIGADGVLFVEKSEKYDFHMKYLNADGGEVSMCGNGSRAISHYFFNQISSKKRNLKFSTKNSVYESVVDGDNVLVEMNEYYDVNKFDCKELAPEIEIELAYYSNTGVPHVVFLVKNVDEVDVYNIGLKVRNNPMFVEGVNVNFISRSKKGFKIRTYERGVEGETLSCGTGITAAARFLMDNDSHFTTIVFESRGGELIVKMEKNKVYFGGIVTPIFKGELC